MKISRKILVSWATVCGAAMLVVPFTVNAQTLTVNTSNSPYLVSSTMHLSKLVIEPGGSLVAPSGDTLTLTVNGVETGQTLAIGTPTSIPDSQFGVNTQFVPGIYQGDIVLTVADVNTVSFELPGPPPPTYLYYPFRQALYLDDSGIEKPYSVTSAVMGNIPSDFTVENIGIFSTGQDFNGIYAAGGTWNLKNVNIGFFGNGRSDFVGYGAAIEGNSADTKLIVDRADVFTHGVVRTAVVADGGSTVVVKNSNLYTTEGVLPAGYVQTVNQQYMMSIPWMLGINGNDNVRATNLLGPSSIAAYINSSIASDSWGVLSTDSGSDCTLVAVNSKVAITPGNEGYGTYAIGNATEYLLGTEFDVGSYSTINTGGVVYYGDSTPALVAALNSAPSTIDTMGLNLGLTSAELAALPVKHTIINSRRFGVMWHSSLGIVNVSGGTIMNTKEDTFLDKSNEPITITIDGSRGAQLNPGNGIILQVMDDDDPGAQGPDMINNGVYVEPTAPPTRDPSFDVTATTPELTTPLPAGGPGLPTPTGPAEADLNNIHLVGDFYNSTGWTFDPNGNEHGLAEQNMYVKLTNSVLTGVITSSSAHHACCDNAGYPDETSINSTEYKQLGEVTNTPSSAINNGAIVNLINSKWVVTSTSYLTSLTIDKYSSINAPEGHTLAVTLPSGVTTISPGITYTCGSNCSTAPIVLTVY